MRILGHLPLKTMYNAMLDLAMSEVCIAFYFASDGKSLFR